MNWIEVTVTLLVAFFGSSGFWAWYIQRRDKKNTFNQLMLGIGHDRIMHLGKSYIRRGYITSDEFENLHDYIYEPYISCGGNGSAKRLMAEVEKLPMREHVQVLEGGLRNETTFTGTYQSRVDPRM